MEQLALAHPRSVALKSFGRTIRGRDIHGLVIGNADNCAAFIGLVHPGESGPELIIPAVERILQNDGELLKHAGLAILPAVSIDQRERLVQGHPGYLRTNYNGVDLNRNFPGEWEVEYTYGLVTSDPDGITYRGAGPGSEPETQAMMAFLEQTKPRCVLSFHYLASLCGPCFLTTRFAKEDITFKERCLSYVTAYTRGFYGTGDIPVQLHFACSAGSMTSWLYREKGIPGFDLESDSDRINLARNDLTTIELLDEYTDRHYGGMVELLQLLGKAGVH
jgi:hypothetical protein